MCSLACMFYFILTGGHAFEAISDPEECQQNIMSLPKGKYIKLNEISII